MSAVTVPDIPVALSTSSAYPENCAAAFSLAERLGYDAVEVMVWTDPVTQEAGALKALTEHHGIPVVSVHAPTLLISQRVWGTDPWDKVDRSLALAAEVGAETVVVHPPFRWQRSHDHRSSDRRRRRHRVIVVIPAAVAAATTVIVGIDVDVPVDVDVVDTGVPDIVGAHVGTGVVDLPVAATTTTAKVTATAACLSHWSHGETGQNENRQGGQEDFAE